MYVCMHAYIYIYMCVCVYMCIYIYMYIDIVQGQQYEVPQTTPMLFYVCIYIYIASLGRSAFVMCMEGKPETIPGMETLSGSP